MYIDLIGAYTLLNIMLTLQQFSKEYIICNWLCIQLTLAGVARGHAQCRKLSYKILVVVMPAYFSK